MALTPSNMMPLGTEAPAFSLPDTVSGNVLTLDELASDKATVVMFICNHCPFVKNINEELVRVATRFGKRGVSFVAISANDAENYPEDAPDKMRQSAEDNKYPFPYLYDEDQSVAKAYDAACTPDFYVFDGDKKCVYRGRFDESTPGNSLPVTGNDLKVALEAVLEGKPVEGEQLPSMGCNIKWK
ncbi:thioredoxin family protein (plasmid) [Fulvitalea axinellae]|uniref:Thioredoxin family protein n=1 Tax=Fulvitalea axinellae TaxID=1182444 RepID=A0AAU9D1E6_9BACT|nr:thioredoxin family protein [Fulvitalea axinellae]